MLGIGQKRRCGNKFAGPEEQRGVQCAWKMVRDGSKAQELSRGQSVLSLTDHGKEFRLFLSKTQKHWKVFCRIMTIIYIHIYLFSTLPPDLKVRILIL